MSIAPLDRLDRSRQGVSGCARVLPSDVRGAQYLRSNRVQGFGSITEQQPQRLPIVPGQMGPSLRFVLEHPAR
jgi:hypothetical protein